MRYSIKTQWVVPLAVLIAVTAAWAGTTGKLSGVVTDQSTGQPIPGAAVSVEGTQWGALTDQDGRFVLLNIPVGYYTLKASIVGYTPMEVKNIAVSVDLTTTQDFQLSTQAVEMGAVTVTAERPLVKQDQTSTLRIVTTDDVQNLPTRGYQDIVGLQTGAVRYNDNTAARQRGARENSTTGVLNLRGGRASEVAYYVDGFSQQDPLTGLSTTQINNNSIEEVSVVSGGFNAEYGLIMSGAVNVTTKEGEAAYHGTVEAITDNFHGEKYDYNVYSAVLNGPVLKGSDKLTFYAAGERRWAGDRNPHSRAGGILPNDFSGLWNWQGKLNWRPSGNIVARLGSIGSQENWREYRRDYNFDIDHTPRYEDKNYSLWGEMTHTLNPKTFYTASLSWFSTARKRGDGVYFDNIWGYGRPNVNPQFDDTRLFYSWDDYELVPDSINQPRPLFPDPEDATKSLYPDSLVGSVVFDTTLDVFMGMRDITGDGVPDSVFEEHTFMWRGDEGRVWRNYLQRYSSYIGGDFDFVSQVHPNHEVKFGAEFQRHTLRRYQHLWPTNIYQGEPKGFQDIDFFGYDVAANEVDDGGPNGVKHPVNLAGYLQDKFEWEGLVVNAGLRFDYFDYRTERLLDPENPLDPFGRDAEASKDPTRPKSERDSLALEAGRLTESDLTESESVSRVSPRLGVAFPVADGSVFHFSYGKFFQRPDLQNLYVNYDYLEFKIKSGGYYFAFGNPNLEPEETTAYEAGWRKRVSDFAAVDVTAFFKDIKNLTEVVTQPAAPNSFSTFRNRDYGTVKGIEIQLDMRRNHGISTQLNYTLQYANGTGSFANTQSNIAWVNSEPPKHTSALEFDQRHKLTGILDIRAGAKEGPRLGETYPLERTGVNFVFTAGSGFPYSPAEVYNEVSLANLSTNPAGPINSRRTPWTYRLDLKANREIPLGRLTLDVYLWVINVFDRENVVDVYEGTGLADQTGWLETPEGQSFATNPDLSVPHDQSGLTATEKYELRQNDPLNFDTPRQIRFGVRWTF
ncbi:MAG: TonB-dependent receptor [Candidatus Zixiibacteriota bacterium]